MNRDLYKLSGAYIELTSQCNLRCLHCYNESGELENRLSSDTFHRIIDSLSQTEKISVTLSGGEPLLHPCIWDFISLVERKTTGKHLMITNATLITKDVAQRLSESDFNIQVSLNGSVPETHDLLCGTGNFSRTMQGVDNLVSVGMADKILIRGMISEFNKSDILPMIKMLTERGIKTINFAYLTPMGRSMDNFEKMYLSIEEERALRERLENDEEFQCYKEKNSILLPKEYSGMCPLVWAEMGDKPVPITPRIDSAGNVFICQLFSGEKWAIGNVNETNLPEIIGGSKFNDLIEFLRYSSKYMDVCPNCLWQSMCGRGCPALSICNGSTQATDGACSLRKVDFIQEFLRMQEAQNQ